MPLCTELATLLSTLTALCCQQRCQTSPQPRTRSAFTRRGPCVPSRSALGLSHALHQVRKQGCPSIPALSSPKGGSRQEIADIARFAAPPGDADRARGSLMFAPPQHAGCDASANPSSSAQQLLRRLQSQSLRYLGAEADVEIGLADPHPVQDARELACNRDDRTQHARPFGDAKAPRSQCGPRSDARLTAASQRASLTLVSPCLVIRPSKSIDVPDW
jgi:hypothetical protein